MENQTTDKNQLKTELIRGAFMILFFLVSRIVGICVFLMAVFQFLCSLIVQKPNDNAKRFGKELSYYIAEIILFLSYNVDDKPWPFSPWPKTGPANPMYEDQ